MIILLSLTKDRSKISNWEYYVTLAMSFEISNDATTLSGISFLGELGPSLIYTICPIFYWKTLEDNRWTSNTQCLYAALTLISFRASLLKTVLSIRSSFTIYFDIIIHQHNIILLVAFSMKEYTKKAIILFLCKIWY